VGGRGGGRILFVLFCCCCSVLLNQNEWLDQQYSQYFDLDAFIVRFFVKNLMGVCIKFYSSRIRWGYISSFTHQESNGLCIKFYS
jgi:hypothetical protein